MYLWCKYDVVFTYTQLQPSNQIATFTIGNKQPDRENNLSRIRQQIIDEYYTGKRCFARYDLEAIA